MRVVRHHIRPLNNTVVNCTFDEHVMMTHSAFAASPSTAGFKVRANKAYILFHIERQLVNRSPVELPTSTTTDLLNQTSNTRHEKDHLHSWKLVVVMKLAAGLLWAAFVVTVVTGQPEVHFRPNTFTNLGADCGRAQQCSGSQQNFTLKFCPTSITLSEPLEISFGFTPLMDHKDGKACYKLYLDQSPDFVLLYDDCSSFNCGIINKRLPNICPFRKGVPAKGTATINLKDVTSFLPVGQFKLRAELISMSGEQFLCAELHFKIPPPSDYDDDYY
ncbi:hypothetical protein LSAT2_028659 [Lamellibrachia satsuma]|nr:hypothetical protein LSAT2_028659 [Lamellibrachia satsuma]